MQKCVYCGADLADNARFCGNCGRVPPQAPQVGAGPQRSSMPQQQQAGGWPQQQPSQNGSWPQRSSMPQQQPQAGGWPQQAPSVPQQTSQAGGWPQQPPQAGSWQQQPPPQAGGWPQQPMAEQFYAQSQASPPQMPPGGSWQQQPPLMPPPGGPGGPGTPGKRTGFPRWLLLALIAVVVIGGGAAAFALLHHSPTTTTGPSTTPTHSTTSGNTPVVSHSPVPTLSAVPQCQGTISHTASLSFSGSASGQMSIIQFFACGPVTVNESGTNIKEYVGTAIGTIGSTPYQFIFGAFPYNGPTTFQSVEVVGILTNSTTSQTWQNALGNAAATITVNADGTSGSLNITMPQSKPTADPNNTVTATGTWSA